jgi:hypothetical protein
MKIDQDLRAAIRSAEKAQPSTDYSVREKVNQECIDAFLKRFPAKAKAVNKLIADELKAIAAVAAARKLLCEKFGLRHYDGKIQFANCGEGKGAFVKAGGKLPSAKAERWKFDVVMAELAAADAKDCRKILSKYGIKWE